MDPYPADDILSPATLARLRASAGGPDVRPVFSTEASPPEVAALIAVGLYPIGAIRGSSIHHVGLLGPFDAMSNEVPGLTRSLYTARRFALARLARSAEVLGAAGVVGITLSARPRAFGAELLEVVASGTAVGVVPPGRSPGVPSGPPPGAAPMPPPTGPASPGQAPSQPAPPSGGGDPTRRAPGPADPTTVVPAADPTRVYPAGVGGLSGSGPASGPESRPGSSPGGRPARPDDPTIGRPPGPDRQPDTAPTGPSVTGPDPTGQYPTGRYGPAQPATDAEPAPLWTTSLDAAGITAAIRMGLSPVSVVFGTCVHHLSGRPVPETEWPGQEVPGWTQAVADAREVALARLQAEAQRDGADGVIALQQSELDHGWGGQAIEYVAVASAVRRV
ncbi:MAG TPA: heavy metal-binding domain-containing protein [Acidimicrobiales bacterium]|nr:heavy metal-binding domain-containing protein [Acidimicrobiales bacterium]